MPLSYSRSTQLAAAQLTHSDRTTHVGTGCTPTRGSQSGTQRLLAWCTHSGRQHTRPPEHNFRPGVLICDPTSTTGTPVAGHLSPPGPAARNSLSRHLWLPSPMGAIWPLRFRLFPTWATSLRPLPRFPSSGAPFGPIGGPPPRPHPEQRPATLGRSLSPPPAPLSVPASPWWCPRPMAPRLDTSGPWAWAPRAAPTLHPPRYPAAPPVVGLPGLPSAPRTSPAVLPAWHIWHPSGPRDPFAFPRLGPVAPPALHSRGDKCVDPPSVERHVLRYST